MILQQGLEWALCGADKRSALKILSVALAKRKMSWRSRGACEAMMKKKCVDKIATGPYILFFLAEL